MDKPQFTINRALILLDQGKLPPDSMAKRLALFHRWCLTGSCIIRDRASKLRPLLPNLSQRIILARMLTQSLAGLPIRLVILKARKHGVSTYIQAMAYFLCAHYHHQVVNMMAHQGDATIEIFQIARLINKEYKAPFGATASRTTMAFPATNSRYICHTAGSQSGAAGGTPSWLHLSEVALWKQNKRESEYASTQAVPFNPTTAIIYESTARGRDLFHERYTEAHDRDNPYIPIFLPWYFDCECRLPVTQALIHDDEETLLIKRAAKQELPLDDEALQWRRIKIKEVGPHVFRQEYPSTPEEAVQAFGNLVIPNVCECYVTALPFDVRQIGIREKVGGIDYGYYDATVILSAIYRDQTLWITKCYRRIKGLAEQHADGVAPGHTYYVDPAALAGRQELDAACKKKRITASFRQAPRKKTTSRSFVAEEWLVVQRLFRQERIKILVGNGTDQIALEADNFEYSERSGEPNYTRSEACGHFDTLDALRYMVMGVVAKDRPIQIHESTGRYVASRRVGMRNW